MAKVRAKVKVFTSDNVLHQEGEVFEYNGPENENLEAVDKDGNVIEKPKAKEESFGKTENTGVVKPQQQMHK